MSILCRDGGRHHFQPMREMSNGTMPVYCIGCGATMVLSPSAPKAADAIEWLTDPEHDRLRWAIARLRGHAGGPERADEQEAFELASFLRQAEGGLP